VDVRVDGDVAVNERRKWHATPGGARRYAVMLSFQKLDVYRASIELLALVVRVTGEVPRGHAAILDQARRAASSVALNIAEGADCWGRGDAARVFAIARGEAMEVAAAIDVLVILDVVSDVDRAIATELLERVIAMLTKMCRQG
jgi:four helix bundle protein